MKKSILFLLIVSSLIVSGQDTIFPPGCKSFFAYSLNTTVRTFAPATAIDFKDLSEGKILSWHWTFGDGNESYEQNPTHIFSHPLDLEYMSVVPEVYRTVTLEILTDDSCRSVYSEDINIMNPIYQETIDCKAEFYILFDSIDPVDSSSTFSFINKSIGENLRYQWDFDYGDQSNEEFPVMKFDNEPRERKVCLTVTNESCEDRICNTLYIKPYVDPYQWDTVNYDCFVDFWFEVNHDVQTLVPSLVLDFKTKFNDQIEKYLWEFGDGTSSDEAAPQHIYVLPSVSDSMLGFPNPFVDVCLTVTTVSGCEAQFCQAVNLFMETWPVEPSCNVWFKYTEPEDVYTIPEVKAYKFYPYSDNNIISYYWEFGDGNTSYEAEPIATFDIFRYSQNVCLTALTADSCKTTWCEEIFLSPWIIDTIVAPDPVCNYTFEYDSYYPPTASSCIGTVTAKVVLGDQKIDTEYFYWSDGTDGPTIEHLCPTNKYTVTALTVDGCKFSGTFVFNSDGTVTELPADWWFYEFDDDQYVGYNVTDSNYYAEWVMCDGTVISGGSFSVSDFNCPENKANFVVWDREGNMIYNEAVDLKTLTSTEPLHENGMYFYPVPAKEELNIVLKDNAGNLTFEIYNLQGKMVLRQERMFDKGRTSYSVDVSTLPKGTYIGKAISDGKTISVGKFIK